MNHFHSSPRAAERGGMLVEACIVALLIGFVLLGLSYGQASGTVTSNFSSRDRYTGAALTTDMAWLIGAAFAPLVALGLSAHFGLEAVSVYLLSGVVCTLVALRRRALRASSAESWLMKPWATSSRSKSLRSSQRS